MVTVMDKRMLLLGKRPLVCQSSDPQLLVAFDVGRTQLFVAVVEHTVAQRLTVLPEAKQKDTFVSFSKIRMQ